MKEGRDSTRAPIGKHRLEFLFDGIYAIAMTILVLDLKVPELTDPHSTAQLGAALVRLTPTFGSYLLSFFILGNFWYRHNQHFHHFQFITPRMLNLHFIQLATAGFFPFCAALSGRYAENGLSWAVYFGCILAHSTAGLLNWQVAWKADAMTPETTVSDYLKTRATLRHRFTIVAIVFLVFLYKVIFR
jgi:uncharacterized membrane protein